MKVVDLHCDTLNELRYARKRGEELNFTNNKLHIDINKMKQGDYMLQCFAAFINLVHKEENPLVTALEEMDIFFQFMAAHPNEIAQVKTWEDLERNRREGRISALLTVEEGGCCLGNLSVLRILHQLGVRIMTLTWNHENELAYPNTVPVDCAQVYPCGPNTTMGVKEKGFEFLTEMEKLGILVDVSHLSDAGFWDVYNHTTKPFIASHSNARAKSSHVRNLTDDMIRAIAERGGVTGINYCAGFLDEQDSPEKCMSNVKLMVDHIDYIQKVGGLDMIALGSDFDGIENNLQFKSCADLPLLEAELRRRHYSEDAIEKIFHKNALRVLREVL